MTRVQAHWGERFVRPYAGKCPVGSVNCWHRELPICPYYKGPNKHPGWPYSGKIVVNCSAPMKAKGKKTP